jgi:hypothetical protein
LHIIGRFEFSGWLLDSVLSFGNLSSIDKINEGFAVIWPLGSESSSCWFDIESSFNLSVSMNISIGTVFNILRDCSEVGIEMCIDKEAWAMILRFGSFVNSMFALSIHALYVL